MTRNCADCGKDISYRRGGAVRCEGCAQARRNVQIAENNRRYVATHAGTKPRKSVGRSGNPGGKAVLAALHKMPAAKPQAGEPDKRPLADAMTALGIGNSEPSFAREVRAFHAAVYGRYADESDPARRELLAMTMVYLSKLERVYKGG